jgi:hypothetical protein
LSAYGINCGFGGCAAVYYRGYYECFDGVNEVFTILDGGNVGIGKLARGQAGCLWQSLLGTDRYANFGTDTVASYGFALRRYDVWQRRAMGKYRLGGSSRLGSLSNVSVGSAASGDLLMFNGSSWINQRD